MRPRTTTVQVWKEDDVWHVEIGDPKASAYDVAGFGKDLSKLLTDLILMWKAREGL
jgi:hypothetical protein